MRVFILILSIFIAACGNKKHDNNDYIRIEHSGPSDELIKIIVISLKELPPKNDWEYSIILNAESFAIINEFFLSKKNDGRVNSKQSNLNEWATFRVIINNSQVKDTCVFSSQEESVKCFSELKELLVPLKNERGVNELGNRLDILLRRLKD